jgi:hypothetical protein
MYTKCLNIDKAHYGEKNFNLVSTYYNLSRLYEKLKDLQKSFKFAEKSYNIASKHYGENHSKTNKYK